MVRGLKIDRAIYIVEDDGRTYRFLPRNPQWRLLSAAETEANKRSLEGYTPELRSGRTRVYQTRQHPGVGVEPDALELGVEAHNC